MSDTPSRFHGSCECSSSRSRLSDGNRPQRAAQGTRRRRQHVCLRAPEAAGLLALALARGAEGSSGARDLHQHRRVVPLLQRPRCALTRSLRITTRASHTARAALGPPGVLACLQTAAGQGAAKPHVLLHWTHSTPWQHHDDTSGFLPYGITCEERAREGYTTYIGFKSYIRAREL